MGDLAYIKNEILHSAATGTAFGSAIDISGFNTGVFDLEGTWVGTVTFQATQDNSNWQPLKATNISTGNAGTTANGTGLYSASLTGMSKARAWFSGYSSGTLSAKVMLSAGGGSGAGGGLSMSYNGTAPTYTSGDSATLQSDVNGNLKVVEQYAPGAEDNTNGVMATLTKPVNSSTYQPSLAVNLGGSLTTLVKGSAGNVYSIDCTNLSGSVAYLQILNVATALPIGSVPVYSFMMPPGTTVTRIDNTFFSPSHNFSTGIVVGIGTAGGTLGTTGLTAANFIMHCHYV